MSTPKTKLIDYWNCYNKDSPSPQQFLDFGFLFMISSALQRRVWLQSPEFAIFPNLYVLLIGPPGVGKGMVIGQVNEFLRFWKIPKKGGLHEDQQKKVEEALLQLEQLSAMMGSIGLAGGSLGDLKKLKPEPEKLVFPIAADSTTYESLMEESSKCVRTYRLPDGQVHDIMAPKGVYMHQSLIFCLEELSSLFKQKVADIGKYLLNAYDCKLYNYRTKSGGEDAIVKPCMNLIAGTTPGFIEDGKSQRIIDDGLFSRLLIVFEPEYRQEKFEVEQLNPEQLSAKTEILKRLKHLSTFFGQVTFTDEAKDYMKSWFETPSDGRVVKYRRERLNKNPKLDTYYSRKKVQAEKLAMAIHFADCDSMVINIDECRQAMSMLNTIELKMHLAFSYGGLNPYAGLYKRVARYIWDMARPVSFLEIWNNFAEDCKREDLEDVLGFLEETKRVEKKDTKYIKGKAEDI